MNIGVFVNVRTGSQRLTNKHFRTINHTPILTILLERLNNRISRIFHDAKLTLIITTGEYHTNHLFNEIAEALDLHIFYGSNDNIPYRHLQACEHYGLDAAISIDGDDIIPSIEALTETVVALFEDKSLVTTFGLPIGMNVHGYSASTLKTVMRGIERNRLETGWMQIFDSYERYQITYTEFQKYNVIRATLDYDDDLKFFERIIQEIENWETLSTNSICDEILKRKIYKENSHLHNQYWKFHNEQKKQEKILKGNRVERFISK